MKIPLKSIAVLFAALVVVWCIAPRAVVVVTTGQDVAEVLQTRTEKIDAAVAELRGK